MKKSVRYLSALRSIRQRRSMRMKSPNIAKSYPKPVLPRSIDGSGQAGGGKEKGKKATPNSTSSYFSTRGGGRGFSSVGRDRYCNDALLVWFWRLAYNSGSATFCRLFE